MVMRLEEAIKQQQFQSLFQKAYLSIVFTGNLFEAEVNQLLKPFRLSSQQFNVLRILRGARQEACNLCDIQERMLDRMSNATRLVEKLRSRGLLTRELCAENRRKVEIRITPKGMALLSELDQLLEAYYKTMSSRLSEQEAGQISELLDKLRG